MALNVLVTGGCGFIGSFVVDRLVALGHVVTVVDLLEKRVHGEHPDPMIGAGTTFYCNHVGDLPYTAYCDAYVVIHLAAEVGVADSMTDPLRYVEQNTLETAQMLCDLRRIVERGKLKRLVVASSMSIYGNGGVGVVETDYAAPASVYGLTKLDQERLCLMWGEMYRVPTLALRFFNVYGPRQSLNNPYTGVLANFAKRLLQDQAPVIFEDGGQTRDFVFVEDVARAVCIAALMEEPMYGAFNICTGDPTTILGAARCLAISLGKGSIEPTINGKTRAGDIRHCTGDPGKAEKYLKFSALYPFSRGVQEYCKWLLTQ